MMCPSVMICGGSNFPVRKKEKQNVAREHHFKDLEYINGFIGKIENILYGNEIIKSNDTDAIEKLQEKLNELERLQQTMKEANVYYKKNNTLHGFEGLKQSDINSIMDFMTRNTYHTRPFESYSLTNNNAKIKAKKQQIERLQKIKEEGTKEIIQSDICQVVENAELMRMQLIFDSKPGKEIRSILKSNGFIWSPNNGAWQRQLTNNARYSTKIVIEKLKQLQSL